MLQDTWALKAQREGYRSRAVYKLEEILVKVKYNNKLLKYLFFHSLLKNYYMNQLTLYHDNYYFYVLLVFHWTTNSND